MMKAPPILIRNSLAAAAAALCLTVSSAPAWAGIPIIDETGSQQQGSAPANAFAVRLPGSIEPRGKIVNRHHARPQRQIGN